MRKAVKIVLAVIAFWVVASSANNVHAQTLANMGLQNVNIGSSSFVYKQTKLASKTKPTPTPTKKPTYTVELPQPAQVYASDIEVQPSPQPAETPTITPIPTATPTNLDANKIFDMVNAYRAQNGLGPFEKASDEIQQLAQVRSTELINEGKIGAIHAGLYNRHFSYWIWENAKYGSDEAGTVAWWISSPLHRRSILGDSKYTAVACTGNYCVQLFTSLIPK